MLVNHVEVTVDGQPVRALVDSGASFSVVSESFRRSLRKVMFPYKKESVVKVADGSYVQPSGTCTLRLSINNQRVPPFEFIILPRCSHTIILGWDFLETSQAIINCGRSELLFDDTLFHSTTVPERFRLCALEDCAIPSHSITKIAVTAGSICGQPNTDVMVQGNKTLLVGLKELAVPFAVITLLDGRGDLWITNGRDENNFIPKNMCIGYAEILKESHIATLAEDSIRTTENQELLMDCSSMLSTDLNSEQKEKLHQMLRKFHELFTAERKENKSKSTRVKHRINTGDHPPISQRAYRVSPTERHTIRDEVEKMLQKGVVQPSESPWASPVVLVRKKDDSWRFCVDYRRLNKITKKDVYPLPRIDDTLDCLKGAQFFSSMDLYSGYWQINVDEADREKTAFITPEGLYEFKVMPFGLCNAPATFERMMDNLLRHLKWTMCLCYLDDVVVFSKTFDEHLQRLEVVLQCLQEADLILNPKKCLFGAKQIKILGHLVSGEGIRPDPDKVLAVSNFPVPKNIHDVRSFLGLCSYFRRFIENFCHRAQPLQELVKGDAKFKWTNTQALAFDDLKQALVSDPVLGLFNEDDPTELHTDASGYGIGAVLTQIQGGVGKVIAYASRILTKAERNYSTTERECLAVIWAVKKFRPYLFGKQFTVVTDHHSLCWLTGLKDPSGRLARWALQLQEYDISVVYKSGKKHKDADSLSRNPIEVDESGNQIIAAASRDNIDIGTEQRKDAEMSKIIDVHERGSKTDAKFHLIDGVLCKKNFDPDGKTWLPIIPKHMRLGILWHFHDAPTAGHLGIARTYDRIRRRFYWPGMYRHIKRYVTHCHECQRRKTAPQQPPGRLMPIPPATAPFHRIGIDLLGRFPMSSQGNRWIVVCTDYFTRYAVTRALPTAEAPVVAHFILEDIILKYGAPRYIITDRGQVFQSNLVSSLIKLCNVNHQMTTAYHPQTNGLTERLNKTLTDMLSLYVDVEQKNWDDALPFVTFGYNTSKQDTTGYTPFFMLHGREAETTLDAMLPFMPDDKDSDYISQLIMNAEEARQLAHLRTLQMQEKDRQRYDSRHRAVHYKVGDMVWIFIPYRKVGLSEKLLKRYFGPYKVLRKLSDVTYEVEDSDPTSRRRKVKDTVHVLRMKPYHDPKVQTQLFEEQLVNDDEDVDDPVPIQNDPPVSENPLQPRKTSCSGPTTRSRARQGQTLSS